MTLGCNNCGAVVFEPDEDGLFYQDQDGVCPDCARICQVEIEENGRAWVSDHGIHADVGQAVCDGSCGVIEEFVGTPGDTHFCSRCNVCPLPEAR